MGYNDIFDRARRSIRSIESEVMHMLPSGKREGREWVALNPTRTDNHLGSFRINLISGKWADFASADAGSDIISLVAYLQGISMYEAALKVLGKHNILMFRSKDSTVSSSGLSKAQYTKVLISKILGECINPSCTPVEDYLKSRGYDNVIPPSIKFHPKLYYTPTKSHYPAMVSVVSRWADGAILGLHRTYLKVVSSSFASKADISPNKMMLGSVSGGAVVLASPESNQPLIIAEGIETALSVYAATGIPTWAALSTSGMTKVIIPPSEEIKQIIIAADSDVAGITAAKALASRLLKEGYLVKIATPPSTGTDFNDLLLVEEGAL